VKANNLTISLPNKGCDKNCPYCISKMTAPVTTNIDLFQRNLYKAKQFAIACGVNNILVTSKGEPMLAIDWIKKIGSVLNSFALEVQTNGLKLHEHLNQVETLYSFGYNVIAISIDDPQDFLFYRKLWEKIVDQNMVVRVTLALTKKFLNYSFNSLIKICTYYGIHQLTLRNITIPFKTACNDKSFHAKEWIEENIDSAIYPTLTGQFELYKDKNFVRSLPFGAKIYDIEDISFTHFKYCIQENSFNSEIRSLIYMEDGHLYTAWDKPGSIIF